MICAYLRVSTIKQDRDNQRHGILEFAANRKLLVDEWVEETVSGRKPVAERQLGQLLERLTAEDVLIVAEISRLGRSIMEVMSLLHRLIERQVRVYSCKEGFELADNINSKVLAFAFGLAAEIERQMISQRTKEALARRKSEGKTLGRPMGSKNAVTKLTGKEAEIRVLLDKRIPKAAIGRIYGVSRGTVARLVGVG